MIDDGTIDDGRWGDGRSIVPRTEHRRQADSTPPVKAMSVPEVTVTLEVIVT